MHYIQKHIIDILSHTQYARFSDMQPSAVDSNAYSYHVKVLLKKKIIAKHDQVYTLAPAGLALLVQQPQNTSELLPTAKVALVLRNQDDENLLVLNTTQPFINSWGLPNGTVTSSNSTLKQSAAMIAKSFNAHPRDGLKHCGDIYVKGSVSSTLVSYSLIHVFSGTLYDSKDYEENTLQWTTRRARRQLTLMPATEQVIEVVKSSQTFFFEEFASDRKI